MRKPVLVVALVLAGLSGFLMWSFARQLEAQYQPGTVVPVLVARAPVAAGAKLSKEQVEIREVPASYVHPSAVRKVDLFAIDGRTLSSALQRGQPLLWSDLEGGDGGRKKSIGDIVPKGQRAFTLVTDRVSSAGGNLRPDDRVDIFATLPQPGGDEVTIPLLQNVVVIAVGSEIGRAAESVATRGRSDAALTASVLVTPEEAQRLAFAQAKGRTSLVVRNPDDAESAAELRPVTWSSLFNDGERREIQKKRDEIAIEQIGTLSGRRPTGGAR